MASGGPGDHPLTDLLLWDLTACGEPVDSLVRDVAALGGETVLDAPPWLPRLWDLWLHPTRSEHRDELLRDLERDLVELRDRLRQDAQERGWEVTYAGLGHEKVLVPEGDASAPRALACNPWKQSANKRTRCSLPWKTKPAFRDCSDRPWRRIRPERGGSGAGCRRSAAPRRRRSSCRAHQQHSHRPLVAHG